MPINDPILYYTFDDVSGSNVPDHGSGGNAGTTANSPVTSSGRIGLAISLNGTNQQINVPSGVIPSAGDMTFAAWVNPASLSFNLFETSTQSLAFDMSGATAAYILFNFGGGGQTLSQPFVANVWQHAMFVHSGGTNNIYVNNVLACTFGSSSSFGSSPAFAIGGKPSGGGAYLNGLIDEFRIYSRALSSTERSDLYGYSPATGKPWVYAQAMRRLRGAA